MIPKWVKLPTLLDLLGGIPTLVLGGVAWLYVEARDIAVRLYGAEK